MSPVKGLLKKRGVFKLAQKVNKCLACFCKKKFHQELKKSSNLVTLLKALPASSALTTNEMLFFRRHRARHLGRVEQGARTLPRPLQSQL